MSPDEMKKQAAIVDEARGLLQAAQAGKVTALAVAVFLDNGGVVARSHCPTHESVRMLGALQLLGEDVSSELRAGIIAFSTAIHESSHPAKEEIN